MTTRARSVKITAIAVLAGLLAGGAVAVGSQQTPDTPGFGRQPANLGQVKNDVKAYYGDSVDASGHHHAADSSEWARRPPAPSPRGSPTWPGGCPSGCTTPPSCSTWTTPPS